MSYQVVVFVRVNNMETLQVEKQETFVIDQPFESPAMSTRVAAALGTAHARALEAVREEEA